MPVNYYYPESDMEISNRQVEEKIRIKKDMSSLLKTAFMFTYGYGVENNIYNDNQDSEDLL